MVMLLLQYDMRAPDFGAPAKELYAAALDQCAWADGLGFDSLVFMEHHASTDGYLPSPIVMAAAAAGRTKNILLTLLLLLPLHHPLHAAEDLAVLDLASGGRLRLVVGAGYRELEYEQFGVRMNRRPSLMERGVDALKKAWTGEPFEYEGRTVRILPRPAQQPRPDILMGGSSKASAERAARIADGYRPVSPNLFEDYRQALAALGKPVPPPAPPGGGYYFFLHVTHDPEGDWKKIAPHVLHENNSYASWLEGAPNAVYHHADSADELRTSRAVRILTPDECVAMAKKEGSLAFKPLAGGLDPSLAWESLRLFEREVLPRIR